MVCLQPLASSPTPNLDISPMSALVTQDFVTEVEGWPADFTTAAILARISVILARCSGVMPAMAFSISAWLAAGGAGYCRPLVSEVEVVSHRPSLMGSSWAAAALVERTANKMVRAIFAFVGVASPPCESGHQGL